MRSGFGHYDWIWIIVFVAIVVFAYLRGRRLIGRQRYVEKRMWMRTVIFAIVTIVAVIPLFQQGHIFTAVGSAAAGFAVGVVVGLFALRFTHMGRGARGLWYVPNLYLGVGLIALLVARFVYEYVVILPQIKRETVAVAAHAGAPLTIAPHPMLQGVLFLVLGYYLVYYGGILHRGRRMQASMTASGIEGRGP